MSYHHPQANQQIGTLDEERRKGLVLSVFMVTGLVGGWWWVSKKVKQSKQKEMRQHIKRSRKLYGEDPFIEADIKRMYA